MDIDKILRDLQKLTPEEEKAFHEKLIIEYKEIRSNTRNAIFVLLTIIVGHFAIGNSSIDSITILSLRLVSSNLQALYIFILPIYSHYLYKLSNYVYAEVLYGVLIKNTSKYESLSYLLVEWRKGLTFKNPKKYYDSRNKNFVQRFLLNTLKYFYIIFLIAGVIILCCYPVLFLFFLYYQVVISINYDFQTTTLLLAISAIIVMNLNAMKDTILNHIKYSKRVKEELKNNGDTTQK